MNDAGSFKKHLADMLPLATHMKLCCCCIVLHCARRHDTSEVSRMPCTLVTGRSVLITSVRQSSCLAASATKQAPMYKYDLYTCECAALQLCMMRLFAPLLCKPLAQSGTCKVEARVAPASTFCLATVVSMSCLHGSCLQCRPMTTHCRIANGMEKPDAFKMIFRW